MSRWRLPSTITGQRSHQGPAAEVERYAKTYGLKRVIVYAQPKGKNETWPPHKITVEFRTGLAARTYSSRDCNLQEFRKKLGRLAAVQGAPVVKLARNERDNAYDAQKRAETTIAALRSVLAITV